MMEYHLISHPHESLDQLYSLYANKPNIRCPNYLLYILLWRPIESFLYPLWLPALAARRSLSNPLWLPTSSCSPVYGLHHHRIINLKRHHVYVFFKWIYDDTYKTLRSQAKTKKISWHYIFHLQKLEKGYVLFICSLVHSYKPAKLLTLLRNKHHSQHILQLGKEHT
jgi:hypothetical protein